MIAGQEPRAAPCDDGLTVADDGSNQPRPLGHLLSQIRKCDPGCRRIGWDVASDELEAAAGELPDLGHPSLADQQLELASRCIAGIDQQIDAEGRRPGTELWVFDPCDPPCRADPGRSMR